MEDNKVTQADTQEPISTETVSTEDTANEYQAPSQEEFQSALKSASNKAKTEILNELGVKSVKEFKTLHSKFQEESQEFDSMKTKLSELTNMLSETQSKLEVTEQTALLDKLGIKDEYKDEILTLAKTKVSDEVSLDKALTDLVSDKYKFTLNQSNALRMGTEKSEVVNKTKDLTDSDYLKKMFPNIYK